MKKLLALALVLVMVLSLFAACNGNQGDPTTKPSTSTTPSDPSNPTDPSNPDNPSNPTNPTDPNAPTDPTDPNAPTDPSIPAPPVGDLQILVVPEEMEIYAGEEIDLMFGVVANEGASLIILDDEDFDQDTPGTYTITYQASLDGVKVTATRVITVLEALSNIALEVRENKLGENKWQGKLLSFGHSLYVPLTQNTELAKQSGVFHNTTGKEIILTVAGTHGCAAILDKNGVVLEGRDGANSKLVNAKNPSRTGSSATTINIGGENVTVSSAFAKQLTIPAGGFAVIVQANYAGSTADTDGRGFMNYNVIYEIGNVVRLFWVDTNETLTPYVNQKPTVTGNNKILIMLGDTEFDLDTAVIAGIIAKDDNGTFASTDDVTLDDIKIVDKGGFDASKKGVYTVKLSVSDGKLTTTFTREIEVKSEGVGTLQIGDNKMNVPMENVAKDKDLSSIGNYMFIIYTSKYSGEIGYANGYGVAIVVNKYGEIVRVYDGVSGKYFDSKNVGGVVDASKCTPAGYLTEAFNSLKDGELVIIAPNATANNAEGGSRPFLYSNRTVGAVVSGIGLTFETKPAEPEDPCKDGHDFEDGECKDCGEPDPDFDPCKDGHDFVDGECKDCGEPDPDYVAPADKLTLTIGSNSYEVDKSTVAIDQTLTAVGSYKFIVYSSAFEGELGFTNGYGVAIVVNKYGEIVRVYDGVSGKFFDKDNTSGATGAGCTAAGYAKEAFDSLQEGETVIIAPNSGDNAHRSFLYSNRTVGAVVSGLGLEFEEKPADKLTLTIGSNTFEIAPDKVAVDQALTAVGTNMFIAYTPNYTGTLGFTNGYGVAIVVNKYGEIVRVYDGVSAKYFDKDNTSGVTGAGCTAAGYAKEAFDSLQDGETLIIAPNNGDNATRSFLYSNRTIGAVVSGLGLTFETNPCKDGHNFVKGECDRCGEVDPDYVAPETLSIGSNSYEVEKSAVAVDQALTAVGSYKFIVYTSAFEGELGFTNGYGVAIVVNKYGEIVRVYDGVSAKYFDKDNTSGVQNGTCTAQGYAKEAFDSLQDGETVIIAPNSGDNAQRSFLYSNRTVGAVVSGLGLTFKAKPLTDKIVIGTNNLAVDPANVAVDQALTSVGTYKFIVYTSNYTGTLGFTNGYGVAIVVNKYGEIVRVYDGVSAKYFDKDNTSGATGAGCTAAGYAKEAFDSLQAGETVIIAPNSGDNAHRSFLYSNRTVGAVVSGLGLEFETK